MGFLDKIFRPSRPTEPTTPVFPGECFSVIEFTREDVSGFATFNRAYDKYPNKPFFPWHISVVLEIVDKNDNEHPTNKEAMRLNELEDEITDFLKQTHVVHPVGRTTWKGMRYLFYYVDKPAFQQEKITVFCDSIMQERGIDISVQQDPKWQSVSLFLK